MRIQRLIVLLTLALAWHTAAAQVTLTRGNNLSVDASSDGRIAMDLRGSLWIVPASGGDARAVKTNLTSLRRPRWSPDASQIAFQAESNGRQSIWIHELASGETRGIGGMQSLDTHPQWHPDGRRLIFASDTDGSGIDLWEVDLATGVRWRVTQRHGDETDPAWSANGRDLVYVHRDGRRWSLVLRRHSQPDEILFSSNEMIAAPSWRPDGSLITFFQSGESGTSIQMVILSKPRLVRTFAENEAFGVAPISWLDRSRMVYAANGQIRKRRFDNWSSRPVQFRATILPPPATEPPRERLALPWFDEPEGKLIIHAARIFDGVASGYRHDQDIVIEGGRITAVQQHSEHAAAIVIDMGDLTVLPGFIDADARLPGKMSISHGPDLLTTGITTIISSHPDAERLNKVWSGKAVPGPRILDRSQWRIASPPPPELDVTSAVSFSNATGMLSGQALPTQFRALRLAGLSPAQTLRAIGVNAAAAMLADPYLGRIATGAAADLVFVDGDPIGDIEAALNVVAVVRNGRFYSVSGLIDRARQAETVE